MKPGPSLWAREKIYKKASDVLWGSKPILCKPERSVRVPRIHPQSVPLKSPSEGLWETVWMDSKQNKTHLITSFIMNLGFFRAGDITLLWNVGKGGGWLASVLHVHVNLACLAGLPTDITQNQTSLVLQATPALLLLLQRWLDQGWVFVIF